MKEEIQLSLVLFLLLAVISAFDCLFERIKFSKRKSKDFFLRTALA
jgi:flagellar biosynthesis protein FlhB